MVMTEEGYNAWIKNPNTPVDIITTVTREGGVVDWPLPQYLLDHLTALAMLTEPTQAQVDEARIPLMNWFRQQREAAAGTA